MASNSMADPHRVAHELTGEVSSAARWIDPRAILRGVKQADPEVVLFQHPADFAKPSASSATQRKGATTSKPSQRMRPHSAGNSVLRSRLDGEFATLAAAERLSHCKKFADFRDVVASRDWRNVSTHQSVVPPVDDDKPQPELSRCNTLHSQAGISEIGKRMLKSFTTSTASEAPLTAFEKNRRVVNKARKMLLNGPKWMADAERRRERQRQKKMGDLLSEPPAEPTLSPELSAVYGTSTPGQRVTEKVKMMSQQSDDMLANDPQPKMRAEPSARPTKFSLLHGLRMEVLGSDPMPHHSLPSPTSACSSEGEAASSPSPTLDAQSQARKNMSLVADYKQFWRQNRVVNVRHMHAQRHPGHSPLNDSLVFNMDQSMALDNTVRKREYRSPSSRRRSTAVQRAMRM